jgi:glutamate synthase domain-containing protein 1
MSNHPEEIRRDIETTRAELSRDVDALSEKVSPTRVLERRVDKAKEAAGGVKDKVMGDKATSTPDIARSQTRGNPLAAGLIAFGVGWLASSLVPATQKEQDVAVAVKDHATEHADAIKQPLTEAANEMKDNLQEPAQHAAEAVKSTVQDAATNVQDEAQQAKQTVVEESHNS